MKRRDAIKLGSALLGGACIASLSGCTPNENTSTSESVDKFVKIEENNFSITPKQTAMYEYSYPLILDKKGIDDLYTLNKSLKNSKITSLYTSIPYPLCNEIHPYFGTKARGINESIKTIDEYFSYIKYAIKKGFKCVYALNSTMPIPEYEEENIYPKITQLFKRLQNIGINDVKIANPGLLEFFTDRFPEMNLHLSTSSEYHSLQNYEYVLKSYPKIKSVNLATDENKNFQLLYNLRKSYPKVRLEILVNEFCVKYCIARCYHPVTANHGFPCGPIINQYLHLVRNNLVYPWEWEYYSAIGINNFKFTIGERNSIKGISFLERWAKFKNEDIESYFVNDFLNKDTLSKRYNFKFNDSVKIPELIERLPDINFFVKNGFRCSSSCGKECRYCYDKVAGIREIARWV